MILNYLAVSRQSREQIAALNLRAISVLHPASWELRSHDLQAALVLLQPHLELMQLLDVAVLCSVSWPISQR